jgi:predicted permease
MDLVRTLTSRLASLFRRSKLDADLDEELRSHLTLAIEENMQRGMSRKEAQKAALRSFGGITQTREAYRTQRGLPLLDQFTRDLRFGCRQLLRSPGFALTAILTLALGLGANTAVFSLISALLLRPLPVPHPEQLAVLNYNSATRANPNYAFSFPVFRTLEKRHDIFATSAAFSERPMQVRGASGNVNVQGVMVSGEFFSMLQTPPLLGRYLTPQDDQKGGASSQFGVVISESFWRSWFNRAPDVVGRKLIIANSPFIVVGVMPRSFIGADPAERPQIYIPLWAEPIVDAPYDSIASGFHSWWMRILARRNPGVSVQQADAILRAATDSINEESVSDAGWLKDQKSQHMQLGVESASSGFSYLQHSFAKPLTTVFILCVAMLLLACLNLASLLLARSAARERELATRLAMGASRRRLIQQLLVESLLIALLGTVAGLIAAPIVGHTLLAVLMGTNSNATLDIALDLRVLGFVALTAIITTLLIGLVPALRATSKSLSEQIKGGSQSVSSQQSKRLLPRILMGLEVALALTLVVGAGLLATSLTRLYRTGLGFDPKGIVNFSLDMNKQSLDGEPLTRWYQSYAETLSHQPGVKSVSYASMTPMDGSVWTETYNTPLSGGEKEVHMDTIAPAFFETMRIPLLAGRDFRWNDTNAAGRKIILNESAASLLFPNRNPIGQQVYTDTKTHTDKNTYEVIAVVGDIHYESIRDKAPASGYISVSEDTGHKSSYTALVRTNGQVAPLAAAARSLAAQMSPDIPPPIMIRMSDQLDDSIASERMMAMLAVFFAISALLVTAIGLYGTLAYATARRTSEIGIRIALGAQRGQVVGLVFRENAWIAAAGALAGLGAALLASRALASFLYGTSAHDPVVLIGSAGALLAVASLASLLPALRASRIEPIQALRTE